MLLEQFNTKGRAKVSKLNDYLMENHNITVSKNKFPRKVTLNKLKENAEANLIKIKGSNRKFQLDPEYAKFLCIKNITEEMLNEGIYDGSHQHRSMKKFVVDRVRSLMENGANPQETVDATMNMYQRTNRFAFSNEYVTPVVIDAVKKYLPVQNCKNISEDMAGATPNAHAVDSKATIAIDEAEVIVGLREILDDLRDYAERMSRMHNEDLVAIFDAMMSEFGPEHTNKFKEISNEIMSSGAAAARQTADEFDSLINRIVGRENEEPTDIEIEFDPDKQNPEIETEPNFNMNEPIDAGAEGEPLGRDEIQVN